MLRIILISIILFSIECVSTNQTTDETLFSDFQKGYNNLSIPPINLAFSDNFRAIKNENRINEQISFFQNFAKRLKAFDRNKLSATRKIDFDLIEYETKLNLERLELEKDFVKSNLTKIPNDNILKIPDGKKWYAYLLKRWVDASVTPDQMFEFGLTEIEKVKGRIVEIQKRSKMNETEFQKYLKNENFFYMDVNEVQKAFDKTKEKTAKNLSGKFPYLDKIPDIKIERGTNTNLVQVPGYYNNQTFYYNYFDKPFNRRQIEWIYVHEAMPGHHYQRSVENSLELSEIKQMFSYLGFIEGWAAYVEDIGWEYDAYPDIYSELGKWEWDLVRSTRISLDVGLNYYGWSDKKALEFWNKHIKNQDDIAMREINRMRRWSAQVITYKYGAKKFLEFKQKEEKRLGKSFDLKEFHRKILENGSLPFSVLEKHM